MFLKVECLGNVETEFTWVFGALKWAAATALHPLELLILSLKALSNFLWQFLELPGGGKGGTHMQLGWFLSYLWQLSKGLTLKLLSASCSFL